MNHMNNDQILKIYEEASQLTRLMLLAAREGNWDHMVEHEKTCAARLSVLIADQPEQPQTPDFLKRKGELIRGMLDDDTQIRLLVEPWLEKLSMLIGNSRQQSRLNHAYGAAP